MKRLFRILHWAARSRYWHRKYVVAQAKADDLMEQLTAELWRQVERGDMYTSAAIMGTRQMYGVAPRTGPIQTQVKTPPVVSHDLYQGLTGIERMEFEAEWWPLAQNKGFTKQQALQHFFAELATRKSDSVM